VVDGDLATRIARLVLDELVRGADDVGANGATAVVAQALRHARALAERERWPVERREALQRERLTELVAMRCAIRRYYREALAGYDPTVGRRARCPR
jgi:hypothetical protein